MEAFHTGNVEYFSIDDKKWYIVDLKAKRMNILLEEESYLKLKSNPFGYEKGMTTPNISTILSVTDIIQIHCGR